MDRPRTIAWLIALVGVVLFAGGIVPMARRIQAYNAKAGFLNLHAETIDSRTIKVEGFPEATLTDVPPQDPKSQTSAVRLDYAGKQTLIPVRKPAAFDLPNLAAYDEWLKALAVYEVIRDDQNRQLRKANSERVVMVVRRTPEGFDPETWGEVRRIDWVFDYYELMRDGTVKQYARRWPRSIRAEERLRNEADGRVVGVPPEKVPQVIAAAKSLIQLEPLCDRTFEYFTAMFVIPKLNVPEYKFADTAFRIEVLGWTLPVTMASVLLIAGGVAFGLAPRSKLRPGSPPKTSGPESTN